MKGIFRAGLLLMAIVISLGATSTNAAVVTSLPGGSVISMPAINYWGTEPQTVAPGITWESSYSSSVFGFTGGYGFSDNGLWSSLTMAGLNTANGTMTFSFSTPVSGVGGFLNYAPFYYGTPEIAVFDSTNTLIESATLNFATGGGLDTGFFYGFSVDDAIISSFTLSNAYIGLANLTVDTTGSTAVPEPATLLLLGLGLVGLAGAKRKLNK
jgi:hypothetical protein